jgi:transcriptional regulator with XRE-family HTH domain
MYHTGEMTGGQFVLEARRRAGLTQRQLASRVGLSQPQIARIESGRVASSYERIVDLVRACGLELATSIAPADDSDWSVARANLALDVDARVRQHQAVLRFARAGRSALEHARAGT